MVVGNIAHIYIFRAKSSYSTVIAVCDLKEKTIRDDPTIMDNVFNMTSRNDENTNSNLNKKEELETKRVANQRNTINTIQ